MTRDEAYFCDSPPAQRSFHTRNISFPLKIPSTNFGAVCRSYSTHTKPERFKLTFENILSDENRNRFLKKCVKSDAIREQQAKLKKSSAVLVSLCHVNDELSLLYTVRSLNLTNHKGEVSFAGGIADEVDGGDPVKTAIRETWEELNLSPSTVDVWGVVYQMQNSKYHTVYGVVGYLGHINLADIKVNPDEVESVFAIPLRVLCEPASFGHTQFQKGYGKSQGYSTPLFRNGSDPPVWGLTAIFTHVTLSKLMPTLYRHQLKFVPKLSL